MTRRTMTSNELLRLLSPEVINGARVAFLGEKYGIEFKEEVLDEVVKLIKTLPEIGDKYEAPARLVMLTAVAPLASQVIEELVKTEEYDGAYICDLSAKLS